MKKSKLKGLKYVDGANCNPSCLCDQNITQLTAALQLGEPFTTGWMQSVKAEASVRLRCEGGRAVAIEVLHLDQFHEPGEAEGLACSMDGPVEMLHLREAIFHTWMQARNRALYNQIGRGYSISPIRNFPDGDVTAFLVMRSDAGLLLDSAGPCEGYKWGWNDVDEGGVEKISITTRQHMERWAYLAMRLPHLGQIADIPPWRICAWEMHETRETVHFCQ